MVKTARYEIKCPLTMDWKQFNKILWTLQNETRVCSNLVSRKCQEWTDFSLEYYEKNKTYPKLSDYYKQISMRGVVYDAAKSAAVYSYSGNICCTTENAANRYKKLKLDIIKGLANPPVYKGNMPIDIHNKNISIKKVKNQYIVTLSLLSLYGKKEYGIQKSEGIDIKISVKTGTKNIIDACISGDYKIGCSKLVCKKSDHKSKWFLNLSYKFEPQKDQKLDSSRIMGIDLGEKYAAYAGFNYDTDNQITKVRIWGDDVIKEKYAMTQRLYNLRSQMNFRNSAAGHGRNTRVGLGDKYANKVSNYTETKNQIWSKYLVDRAIYNHCGTIQMEDLTGLGDKIRKDKFLRQWTYYQLQKFVEYKAKEKGIRFKKVSPQYTSLRCSKCGHIEKANRPNQETFICKKCGYSANADYNAACNIATKNIDNIIEAQCKVEGLTYKTKTK